MNDVEIEAMFAMRLIVHSRKGTEPSPMLGLTANWLLLVPFTWRG